MSEHTPGPWEIEIDKQDSYIQATCPHTGTGVFTVALLTDGFGYTGGTKEYKANARLIAAAPELLAALSLMEKTFNSNEMPEDITVFAVIEKARTAISKATGGNNE